MQHKQSPLLGVVREEPATRSVEGWEARFETDLAVILRRYLVEHPPPAASRIARDAERWAENLERLGQARLVAADVRRLRSA
jgi:hypothetical protein